MDEFQSNRTGTGTGEWAEHNENIQLGCSNGCLYCYASNNAHRFKLRTRNEWGREELTKKAERTTYPLRKGVIMFPTAHDITPFNLDAYTRQASLMLERGNKLLIVSKPRVDCITHLVEALGPYKAQIMFRFTIGTMDAEVARFWEPGAPSPAERIQALQIAHWAGYRTSISAEPLLGGCDAVIAVLSAVRPYVTDTVWIGKMNKIRTRVDQSLPENREHSAKIERLQSDGEILHLVETLAGDPLVRWKDSIQDVIASIEQPGPDQVREAREKAGLSQSQSINLVSPAVVFLDL